MASHPRVQRRVVFAHCANASSVLIAAIANLTVAQPMSAALRFAQSAVAIAAPRLKNAKTADVRQAVIAQRTHAVTHQLTTRNPGVVTVENRTIRRNS